MALKLNKPKPAEATVVTENKTKGELTSSASEGIDTSDLTQGQMQVSTLEPYADVGFALSYTHNLGDFKSTRVEVSLKLPIPLSDLEEGYAKAKEWVEGKLQPIVDELVSN